MLPLLVMIESNSDDALISATAAGLLANLAVHDTLGHRLVDFGAISALKQMFKNEFDNKVFLQNATAALSNCSTSPLFIQASVENKIAEDLYRFHMITEDEGVITLIRNSLTILGADPWSKTTSFHLASMHGLVEIFDRLMIENEEEADIDFNSKDSNGRTMISYAIQRRNSDMVAFLIYSGAFVDAEEIPQELKVTIQFSQERAESLRREYEQVLIETLPLAVDLSVAISTYLSPYMLMLGKYGTFC